MNNQRSVREQMSCGFGLKFGRLWRRSTNFRDSAINIDADGVGVTFKGAVSKEEQKQKAIEAAKKIEGVKAVKDLLKILN
jgi:osmotically-inducible protein OsmY